MTPDGTPTSLLSLVLAVLLAACGSSEADTVTATVAVSFGGGSAPVVDPPPSKVVVTARTSAGELRDVGTYGWPPPSSISVSGTAGEALLLALAAVTDAGTVPLRAETPFVRVEELAEGRVTLLVGSAGGFVTTPTPLSRGLGTSRATLVLGRYALGAEGAGTVIVDSATFGARAFADLPLTPTALAAWTPSVIAVVGPDTAALFDVTSGASRGFDVPAADVAGCRAVLGGDGTYFVGPTREAGSATVVALRSAPTAMSVVARKGGSAAWVTDVGLVVAGGDADSVEVIAPSATAATIPFTGVEPTLGAIVAPLGNRRAALLGGGKPTRLLSLDCQADCVSTLPETVELARGEAFQVGQGALAFGEDPTGHARAVYVKPDGTTKPVALSTARRGASAVPLGDGYVMVLGGVDDAGQPVLAVELFTPP